MKRNILKVSGAVMALSLVLCTPAFAIEESEVENAIAASSNEAVAGNIFLWFLCAVAFLKISQKIDSFLAGLGVNVGRTGGSMLTELLIAGRAIGAAASGLSGAAGNIFNRSHASSNSTTRQAAGQAFVGSGGGLVGVAKRAAGNAAAGSVTGTGSGFGSVIGGAMFGSSMASGGKFAEVVGAVATGNIASVGSIKGEQAAQALTNYLGYGSVATDGSGAVPTAPVGEVAAATVIGEELDSSIGEDGEVTITQDGGAAGGASIPGQSPNTIPSSPKVGHEAVEKTTEAAPGASPAPAAEGTPIPSQPPTFRDVEIGGGRITGYETPVGGGEERQFAMYNASQYMVPSGPYEVVKTVDGESWYKQYAQPTVQKTPYEDASGKIKYNEKIVEQMPQIPKRKDRV